jgi:hypothetical protein
MVHRADLPYSVCERAPGMISAIDCDVAALVCPGWLKYDNGTGAV